MASATHLLIDADIYLYQVASVTEQVIDWGDEIVTAHCNMTDATTTFDSIINGLVDNWPTQVAGVTLAASSTTNFRKDLWPEYKGHRSSRKPVGYAGLKGWVQKKYGLTVVPSLEADDVLGIIATSGQHEHTTIVSTDKDFRQIPGDFYDVNKDAVFTITPEAADRYHMFQTLTGDTADGYKGCPGVGPKRADSLLDCPVSEWWDRIVAAYEHAGLDAEEALLNARLARILRATDWDPKTKEVKLWVPPANTSASSAEDPDANRVVPIRKAKTA